MSLRNGVLLTADKILSGFTAHDKGGEPITGTCEYDVDSSDATAAVAEILQGKTAYVRGQKLTGTMKNNGAVTGTISSKDEDIAGQVDQCLSTIDYFVNSHILSSSLLEIKKKNGFTLCPLATHLYLPA
jgi:hypothetical protein